MCSAYAVRMNVLHSMLSLDLQAFRRFYATERRAHPTKTLRIPIAARVTQDQLTPVLAYRRLVRDDSREAPSFLLESVENGSQQSRYSLMGNQPELSVRAKGAVITRTHHGEQRTEPVSVQDPFRAIRLIETEQVVRSPSSEITSFDVPQEFLGGWVGYAGYDTVRYAEERKLPFESAPTDDRGLDDVQFSLYPTVVLFDHVTKLVLILHLATLTTDADPDAAYHNAVTSIEQVVHRLSARDEFSQSHLFSTRAHSPLKSIPEGVTSTLSASTHAEMVQRAQAYIRAGDAFQLVLGQRLETHAHADPFDVYRALRIINPSPYMGYVQGPGVILVAASPEILCRVRRGEDGSLKITNRPLAGTRPRGASVANDVALAEDLLADPKEIAEHAMLVDLGRNDVGRVAIPASTQIDELMSIERYSHVMHISSTVTGTLQPGLDGWDALASTLPVGTISGAPKVRAMQIIDELEPVKRGPYGGGFGWAGLNGEMDLALALRTIVVPTALRVEDRWTYHLQASGGIVADSEARAEFQETLNKAAAPLRAVQLASSWGRRPE